MQFRREGTVPFFSGVVLALSSASGSLIGYVEQHINSWDCLGALAIIQAAGGKTNDFLANDGLWKGNRLIAGPRGAVSYPRIFLRVLIIGSAGHPWRARFCPIIWRPELKNSQNGRAILRL